MSQREHEQDRGSGPGEGASSATIGKNPGHVGRRQADTDHTDADVTHAMPVGKDRPKDQDEGSRSPR